jgi:hypothetical protein
VPRGKARHFPPVTQSHLPTAEFYDEKAEALRRLGLEARDDSVKRQLMMLALEFEKLAERARRLGRAAAY